MKNEKIVMIDYGASNIRSAQKAFEHLGADVTLTDKPEIVSTAKKLVLPGVGAFGAGMQAIRKHKLDEAIINAATLGTPLLGICLGMQFLFEQSDEMGVYQGLGLIPGQVTRFKFENNDLKVPHMGWNQIEPCKKHPLMTGVEHGEFVYFVHSYYCAPTDKLDILAQTQFGFPFTSGVSKENIMGIQFHPEKSQKTGLKILRNFIQLC